MKKITLLPLLLLCILALNGCRNSSTTSNASPSLALAGSKQGQSVGFADLDGDGISDKVVGAPYSSTTSLHTGALLAYKGSSTGYSTIPTSVLLGDDNLGFSFVNLGDIDGDGREDFAAGAIHGSGDGTGKTSLCGSVTIYKGGSGGQVVKKLSGDGPMDKFGFALAAGDLNNDGTNDLIVSAPFNTNDPALYQSGAVYAYFGPDFGTRVALYATSANKGLGLAVAAGDVNGDNIADLLISASGKVLVYYGSANFAPSLNAPDITLTSTASGFGKSLVVIGDLDGDGRKEIAAGAPNATINNNRDTGSVYIVKGSAAGTVNVSATTPPADLIVRIDGEGLFNRFGSSIAAIGDVDADGKPDFAVGAPMADVTAATGQNILSGKVYVFKGKDISSSATIAAATAFTGKVKNQGYGTSLAIGKSGQILIGAPRSNADTGGADMIDPATGQAVPGGSSGGATGGSGDCH